MLKIYVFTTNMYLLCGEVRRTNREKLTPMGDNKVMLLLDILLISLLNYLPLSS